MGFRFRLGPFTFGRTGIRLSLWRRGAGMSVPLTGKGRTFGKVGVGPVNYNFSGSPNKKSVKHHGELETENILSVLSSFEKEAVNSFRTDRQFINRISQYGVPWRGVQERLKEELPENLQDRDQIAYKLVPKAMDIIFGGQKTGWQTEKRPAKSGRGYTTWIVIIDSVA